MTSGSATETSKELRIEIRIDAGWLMLPTRARPCAILSSCRPLRALVRHLAAARLAGLALATVENSSAPVAELAALGVRVGARLRRTRVVHALIVLAELTGRAGSAVEQRSAAVGERSTLGAGS